MLLINTLLKLVPEKILPPVSRNIKGCFPFLQGSIAVLPTDPNEIINIIASMKNSAACRIDLIPVSVIKSI